MSNNEHLKLIVDLDERGMFKAHVENEVGDELFSFDNEDEEGYGMYGELDLVTGGFMKHGRDADGLLQYLKELGIAEPYATMEVEG